MLLILPVAVLSALSSALAEFDLCRLNWFEAVVRRVLFVCLAMDSECVGLPAMEVATGLIAQSYLSVQIQHSARKPTQTKKKRGKSST